MLKKHLISGCIAVCLALCSSSALAELVLVVHPSNADAIDSKTVKRIFLGKEKKFPSGSPVTPVNQVADSAVRGTFDDQVLGRSSAQVSAYWSKLVFSGKGNPPKEVGSDQEMIDLISKNPSFIGYVDSSNVTGDVKVVVTF